MPWAICSLAFQAIPQLNTQATAQHEKKRKKVADISGKVRTFAPDYENKVKIHG
jgi:hypothetical protein